MKAQAALKKLREELAEAAGQVEMLAQVQKDVGFESASRQTGRTARRFRRLLKKLDEHGVTL